MCNPENIQLKIDLPKNRVGVIVKGEEVEICADHAYLIALNLLQFSATLKTCTVLVGTISVNTGTPTEELMRTLPVPSLHRNLMPDTLALLNQIDQDAGEKLKTEKSPFRPMEDILKEAREDWKRKNPENN